MGILEWIGMKSSTDSTEHTMVATATAANEHLKEPGKEQVEIDMTLSPPSYLSVSEDRRDVASFGGGDKITFVNDAFVPDVENLERQSYYAGHTEESKEVSRKQEGLNTFLSSVSSMVTHTTLWMKSKEKYIRWFLRLVLLLLYNVYLSFAIYLTWDQSTSSWCNGIKFLVLITAIVYLCVLYSFVLKRFLVKPLYRTLSPVFRFYTTLCERKHVDKIVWSLVLLAVLIFLLVDTQENRRRLISFGGLLALLLLGFIFSAHPTKVVWRHVLWGMMLQFVLGILILRWDVGKEVFQCLGDKMKAFLDFTDKGSTFVFGYLVSGELKGTPLQPAVFAFKILTVVIFFSFFVSILYYYGVMQVMVMKVGWLLHHTMGTTACESMNAAGNIFLGMTEAPLLIRPYLPILTKSELHAVLTGGFATIAGSVLAAYINFGVSASHLLSASVMSAPAALAFSKLFYPETEESQTHAENIKIEKPKEINALEAAANGASTAISLVANIAANLVAFVAFIAFLDGIFTWFGSLVNWDFLSFEWLLSKIFIPLSLAMGVDWDDREHVAKLVGLKTVVNEFVAYSKLAEFQESNMLSPRSEAIATYALCGFSNISSIGIQIGALGTMAPGRKSDLSSLALRAMIAGSAACFMTACIAGTLISDEDLISRKG